MNIGVVHGQGQAFSDEMLGKKDEWALTQIVGSCLERKADHTYATLTAAEYFRDRVLDVNAIGSHDARVHWQFHIPHFRHVGRCPEVLRQARPAKSETG